MDTGSSMSPADFAAVSGNGFGAGNGLEGLIYLAVIAAMFGGGFNGFGGNRGPALGYENLATSNEVQRGFDTQNIQAQTRDILSAVTNGTAQSVAATNNTFHDTLAVLNDKYSELQRDIAGIAVSQANALANQNACCCDTKMLIQQTSADNALAMSQMEARLVAKMDANEIQALRDKVDQLQLAQATNGMLRFPNSWSYGAGQFPPIFGGCCGQGNI